MPHKNISYAALLIACFTVSPVAAQENHAFDPFGEREEIAAPLLSPIATPGHALPKNSLPVVNELNNTRSSALAPPASLSRIETYYSGRIIDELKQFGYEMFAGQHNLNADTPLNGAIQDDFILSAGDRVTVILRGQTNSQKTYQIATNGLLTLDNLSPVPAAARTLSQVEAALKSQMASLPNIDLYLSLDKVRQIDVLVIGHVNQPGRQTMTAFNTILDALSMAGGITKDGSLRQIKLIRSGRTQLIDLYSLLIYASDIADIQLKNGDRIIIPPLGPTLAVSGNVHRPGIYELRKTLNGMNYNPAKSSETLNMEEVLTMAGGVLSPGQNRFMHLSVTQNGYEDVIDVADTFKPQFHSGSILMVSPTDETRQGQVEISGHSRKSGIHPLSKNKTLSALLSREALGEDIYPLMGIIERHDQNDLKQSFLPFPLHLVIKNQFDQRLADGDTVHLFSKSQIHNLALPEIKEAFIPIHYQDLGSSASIRHNHKAAVTPLLSQILKEHSIHLKGAVRLPGAYPVSEGVTLEDILNISGGLTLEANKSRIEVTSDQFGSNGQAHGRSGTQRMLVNLSTSNPGSISLVPGDTVRVNQTIKKLNNESVLLAGEVVQPGEYNLMPGDTLSTLFARAGGLTPEAYPEGAIFSRAQERKAEEQRYRATANDIERSLAAALDRNDDQKPNHTQIEMVRGLAAELKNVKAVGRITVEASPDKLLSTPELDILLEAGDRIYMPKRPYNVRVRGEVLSPSNLQFRSGKAPRDYLMEAGGYTHFADKNRTFVIYPDGSAQPLQVSNWNYDPVMIPPGSTIIVPRDPKPFDFMETAKDISQILGNLAISAVVIDDIQDDD